MRLRKLHAHNITGESQREWSVAEVRYERVHLYQIRSQLRMVILEEGEWKGFEGLGELEILRFPLYKALP